MAEKIEELNSRPFKKRPGNRDRAFEEEEKGFLQPLPGTPYEPTIWLNPKVGTDYLITDGINKYSVPYDLTGESVDVRISRNTVGVFFHTTSVAAHVRIPSFQRNPVVKPEHMPEAHCKYLHYNKEEFEAWTGTIGPNAEKVVHHFPTDGKKAEQGYKSCASLT